VGGLEHGLRGGRQRGTKALVVVAVEIRGAGSGRLRMQVINDASAATLCGFVQDAVAPGASVHTDGWPDAGPLGRLPDPARPRQPPAIRHLRGDLRRQGPPRASA
jgi:hypothetical protein